MNEREVLAALQRALADAPVDVDRLLADAWEEARTEVQQVLRRLVRQDLLERVLRELDGGAPSSPAASTAGPHEGSSRTAAPGPPADPTPHEPLPQREAAGPSSSATYVYGVLGDGAVALDALPQLPGGGPHRTVELPAGRALVCDVDPAAFAELRDPGPEVLDRLAEVAHAHDDVLRACVDAPVLPLPLATVLPDDRTVAATLGAHADRLGAELARLADHHEWTVRIVVPPPAREPTSDDPAAYLGARRDQLRARDEHWAREQAAVDAVDAQLGAVADQQAELGTGPLGGATAPRRAFLVDRAGLERFYEQVAALADELDVELQLDGPLPPYHFVSLELEPHR